MITKLSQIVEEAQKKGRKRLAVAYGQDSHTLSAVYDAYKEGLVEPTLYGDKQVIEEVCGAEGIDCSIFKMWMKRATSTACGWPSRPSWRATPTS